MTGLTWWLIQRVTALLILGYTAFLTGYIVYTWDMFDYATWHHLHGLLAMRIASTLMLVSVVWHAIIGIRTVTTDYLHPVFMRSSVEVLSFFGLLSWAICGISIVWGVV
ncbi:MAG: succinate dehydrogenase, hydrophobic membrane anchor protein [Pseudomonadota bacterium]